jgi:DNA polymerase/3'-5' exonuclease PolX
MNTNIISEFEKLVNYMRFQVNKCKETDALSKDCIADQFRLSNISKSLAIIKNHPSPITIDNLKDFKQPGIGKGTLDRIKEILESGKLSELKDFKDISNEEKKNK